MLVIPFLITSFLTFFMDILSEMIFMLTKFNMPLPETVRVPSEKVYFMLSL